MGDVKTLNGMLCVKAEPCYDIFCERCLSGPAQKTTKPKNFNCQSCKKPIPPPKPPHLSLKGADLQTALVLKSLIDKLQVYEDGTKSSAAEAVVVTNQPMLEPVVKRDPDPTNGNDDVSTVEKVMCRRHPDMEVNGFCSDCSLLTCNHCAIDGHERCSNLMTILEAVAFQKQNMSEAGKEKRREMSQFGLKTQFSVGLIENEIENFTRQAEKAKTEIRFQAQRLTRQIREEEEKFVNQVDKCYNEDLISLKELKEIFDNFRQCGEVFMPVIQNQKDVSMEYLVKVDLFSRTMTKYNELTDPQVPSLEFRACRPQHINLGVITIFHEDFHEINEVLD